MGIPPYRASDFPVILYLRFVTKKTELKQQTKTMTLRLGDTVPDFTQDSTDGVINFHDWIGDQWAILFSHPKDFTPVCTTELGTVAKLKPEFDKRNIKAIALSVDGVESHKGWVGDIEETQNATLNYPILADEDKKFPNFMT